MDATAGFAPVVSFEALSTQAWARLVKACAVSFLLHVVLLVGLPVNPTGGVPNVVSVITARLEPAAPAESEPAAEPVALVPAEPVTPPVAVSPPKPPEPKPEARPEQVRASAPPSAPSSGIELPFIRDPTYYPAKQLDVYPQPLTAIRLDYPDAASKARVDGRLLVLLLIDEFGVVNDASVVEVQPEGYFEEPTLAVFRSVRFSPAQKQGHAVKSRVLLQVRYTYGESTGAAR